MILREKRDDFVGMQTYNLVVTAPKGYIHWSLLDNVEWSSAYGPRAGLVAVDRTTFTRTPKPSLVAYRQLVSTMRRVHSWA